MGKKTLFSLTQKSGFMVTLLRDLLLGMKKKWGSRKGRLIRKGRGNRLSGLKNWGNLCGLAGYLCLYSVPPSLYLDESLSPAAPDSSPLPG